MRTSPRRANRVEVDLRHAVVETWVELVVAEWELEWRVRELGSGARQTTTRRPFIDGPHGVRAVDVLTSAVRDLLDLNAWLDVASRDGAMRLAAPTSTSSV